MSFVGTGRYYHLTLQRIVENELRWFGKVLSPSSRRANRIRKRNLIPNMKRIQKEIFKEINQGIACHNITLWHRARRLNHKLRGLCLVCDASSQGKSLCPRHLEKQRTQTLKMYNKRQGENKCIRCGAPLISEEIIYCFACMAERNHPVIKGGVLKYETAN
mgnify:CR=1 FL=1